LAPHIVFVTACHEPSPMNTGMSNLQLRVISAVLLAAAVLVLRWLGGLPFRLLGALVAGAIFYEWSRMARSGAGLKPVDYLADALMAVFVVALIVGWPAATLFVLLAILVLAAAAASWLRGRKSA